MDLTERYLCSFLRRGCQSELGDRTRGERERGKGARVRFPTFVFPKFFARLICFHVFPSLLVREYKRDECEREWCNFNIHANNMLVTFILPFPLVV